MPKPTRSKESLKKRKFSHNAWKKQVGKKAKADYNKHDEEIESDDEEPIASLNENGPGGTETAADSFFLQEAPDEQRIRLTNEYIQSFTAQHQRDSKQTIEEVLREGVDLAERKDLQYISQSIHFNKETHWAGHRLSPTCIACSPVQDGVVYTGGKDCRIIMWNAETGQKVLLPGGRHEPKTGGHTGHVLSLCVSEDGRTLCSAGADSLCHLWDCRLLGPSAKPIGSLKGHRDAITSVCTEPNSEFDQIFTASKDRMVHVWSLRTQSRVMRLAGHTSAITMGDTLLKNRFVTASEDHSLRFWKMDRQTHSIFETGLNLVDAVSMINGQMFVSGSQDGVLNLWNTAFKSPIATQKIGNVETASICSLMSLTTSDTFFSGGNDGAIKTWKIIKAAGKSAKASIEEISNCQVRLKGGFINALCLSKRNQTERTIGRKFLYAAVGQEHRLGRWHCKERGQSKNGLVVIPIEF